jgi:starch phosphorylase
MFNDIVAKTKGMPNCAILTGYELGLSALLKRGSDVWVNNPKIFREASGTSGMTAAMNGSINLSIPDGWVPEFAKHGKNAFSVEAADRSLDEGEQNRIEANNIYDVLEREVIPTYYENPEKWFKIIYQAWVDVRDEFDSGRMAKEYYELLYNE